jgi:hypothetical protein
MLQYFPLALLGAGLADNVCALIGAPIRHFLYACDISCKHKFGLNGPGFLMHYQPSPESIRNIADYLADRDGVD